MCSQLESGRTVLGRKADFGWIQELQDSMEQPGRVRAQSGRLAAKASLPGWSV
jgi:hypothetical protein